MFWKVGPSHLSAVWIIPKMTYVNHQKRRQTSSTLRSMGSLPMVLAQAAADISNAWHGHVLMAEAWEANDAALRQTDSSRMQEASGAPQHFAWLRWFG